MSVIKVCPQCNNEFSLSPSRLFRQFTVGPFCSRACVNKYYKKGVSKKKTSVSCYVCSTIFEVYDSRLKRGAENLCCSRKCDSERRIADTMGRIKAKKGYTIIRTINGDERVHVLMAEKALGRKLKKGEVVHHINLNKADNRNSNLLICSNSYHMWLHQEMQRQWVNEHILPYDGSLNTSTVGETNGY
jgi:hypothetical protein